MTSHPSLFSSMSASTDSHWRKHSVAGSLVHTHYIPYLRYAINEISFLHSYASYISCGNPTASAYRFSSPFIPTSTTRFRSWSPLKPLGCPSYLDCVHLWAVPLSHLPLVRIERPVSHLKQFTAGTQPNYSYAFSKMRYDNTSPIYATPPPTPHFLAASPRQRPSHPFLGTPSGCALLMPSFTALLRSGLSALTSPFTAYEEIDAISLLVIVVSRFPRATTHILCQLVHDLHLECGCLLPVALSSPFSPLYPELRSSLGRSLSRRRNTSELIYRHKVSEYLSFSSLPSPLPLLLTDRFFSSSFRHISTTGLPPYSTRQPLGAMRLNTTVSKFLLHEMKERGCQRFPSLPSILVRELSSPDHARHTPQHQF